MNRTIIALLATLIIPATGCAGATDDIENEEVFSMHGEFDGDLDASTEFAVDDDAGALPHPTHPIDRLTNAAPLCEDGTHSVGDVWVDEVCMVSWCEDDGQIFTTPGACDGTPGARDSATDNQTLIDHIRRTHGQTGPSDLVAHPAGGDPDPIDDFANASDDTV